LFSGGICGNFNQAMAAPGRVKWVSSTIYPDFSKKYPVGRKYFFNWQIDRAVNGSLVTGHWFLEFGICLEFGAWNLVLGIWNLELVG